MLMIDIIVDQGNDILWSSKFKVWTSSSTRTSSKCVETSVCGASLTELSLSIRKKTWFKLWKSMWTRKNCLWLSLYLHWKTNNVFRAVLEAVELCLLQNYWWYLYSVSEYLELRKVSNSTMMVCILDCWIDKFYVQSQKAVLKLL